jgi:hypothetical protein
MPPGFPVLLKWRGVSRRSRSAERLASENSYIARTENDIRL